MPLTLTEHIDSAAKDCTLPRGNFTREFLLFSWHTSKLGRGHTALGSCFVG